MNYTLNLRNGYTITVTTKELVLKDTAGKTVESAQRVNPALQNKVCEWCKKYDGCDYTDERGKCHLLG